MTISRRDFLKFSALLSASTLIQPGLELLPARLSDDPNAKNVLIVLFDALSAANINFYGYPRETMPNLTRLLDRATVYHNHYASSNFTTPGTASLLTGRHVWEHLVLKITDTVTSQLATHNIFNYFDDYYKLAYSHNYYADILLTQFHKAITHHEFFKTQLLEWQLSGKSTWFDSIMRNDFDTATLFKVRLSDTNLDGYLYSLLFHNLLGSEEVQPPKEIAELFPRGFPMANKKDPFILENAIDWIMLQTSTIDQPFLAYFHFLPPHAPYNTREDFVDAFPDDRYQPLEKAPDPYALAQSVLAPSRELRVRQRYDEFILYADSEFSRLFSHLESQGVLENTIVVLTSDHGEIIERGIRGHNFPYLFEPVVKVPLIIFEPGQTERRDIHSITSCIDVLPTLLHCTGREIPSDLPGQILPPFQTSNAAASRDIYAIHTSKNKDHSHITTNTLMMRRENKKVIRYSGYTGLTLFRKRAELLGISPPDIDTEFLVFDLENDPEELNNLASDTSPEIQSLIQELEEFYRENVEYPKETII